MLFRTVCFAILAFVLLDVTPQSFAAPSLDPMDHPYLATISTDKAFYPPKAAGAIVVSLRNSTRMAFEGQALVDLYRNRDRIARFVNPVTIAIGGNLTLNVPFEAPGSDFRGLRIDVRIRDPSGTTVDHGFGSIDVQSGVFPTHFPRQCWVSKWGNDIDALRLIESQVAWRCNIIQAYANYYKPELAPPPTLTSWQSLPNEPVQRATIARVIAAAHEAALPVLFFQGTGEAYDTFLAEKTGPSIRDGSFRRACSTAVPCGEADMDRSPIDSGWSQYGWVADHLDLFDLCSRRWQKHLLDKSIKPMLDQFAFDGWQADTLGPPLGPRYDFSGRLHDPGACLSKFTSGAQRKLGKPVVVNNVSGWHADITALAGSQPMIYRETWNFDSATFPALDALTDGSVGGLRRYTSRPIIQPAYLQRARAERCAKSPAGEDCSVNISSPLLATAMFAIVGSTFMNHPDDGCIATGVFMEGYHLPCSQSVIDRLLAYKNFEVAYQPLLRDGATPSPEPCVVDSGVVAGTTGQANQAFVLGRTKAGYQICQVLNLSGIRTNDWTDLEGTMPTPTPAKNIEMRLYYIGSPVTPEANRLWWASPDSADGAAIDLPYTVGRDVTGNFVTFTLPSLAYWSMVVLETAALADGDFHINPYELIRGANFNAAPNGVGSARSVTTGTCCGRWAVYTGLEFGPTSPAKVRLLYGASRPSTVTFRLDNPKGRLVGACLLAASGGPGRPLTTDCQIRNATGRRDLFITFRGKPISLYSFSFSP